MKVLVTGGAGFIGSHIVDKLIEMGNRVIIIDNLSTGKEENINPKALFFNIDIMNPTISDIFKRERPEFVIHQAGQVDVSQSMKDPINDAKVNIIGGLNLLENCRKYGVKKIVYGNSGGAGSGEPQYLPIDEAHPIKPLCHYGVSKHTVEHYLEIYSQLYGLKFTSLRYANVYGDRQDPFGEGGVVAIFIHKMLNDEVPKIFGDGEQTRDFVYVGDVADSNIMALKKGDNNIFNVGTGTEISINRLANMIKKVCGSNIKPKYVKSRDGEIIRSVLSCDKIKKEMGWKDRVNLEDGLKKTCRFFKNE